MQTHQRYAMKFLGVSFVVMLVVGGVFGWLATASTGTLPIFFSFIGSLVVGGILVVLLFKYVSEMITEQRSTSPHAD